MLLKESEVDIRLLNIYLIKNNLSPPAALRVYLIGWYTWKHNHVASINQSQRGAMQYLQTDNTNRNIGLWTLYIAAVFVSLAVLETLLEVPAVQ